MDVLPAESVCTDIDASTTLNRAVDCSIGGPAVKKVVTAVRRVSVAPGKFDCLIKGYRLINTALFGDHYCSYEVTTNKT